RRVRVGQGDLDRRRVLGFDRLDVREQITEGRGRAFVHVAGDRVDGVFDGQRAAVPELHPVAQLHFVAEQLRLRPRGRQGRLQVQAGVEGEEALEREVAAEASRRRGRVGDVEAVRGGADDPPG